MRAHYLPALSDGRPGMFVLDNGVYLVDCELLVGTTQDDTLEDAVEGARLAIGTVGAVQERCGVCSLCSTGNFGVHDTIALISERENRSA